MKVTWRRALIAAALIAAGAILGVAIMPFVYDGAPPYLAYLNWRCESRESAYDYPKAQKSCAIAIEQSERMAPGSKEHTRSLSNLAWVYYDQGKYADAESLFKRALALRENALGPEHEYVSVSLQNLADVYERQGRYADAENAIKRETAIDEKSDGAESTSMASDLGSLARIYALEGKYADAEQLAKRALAIDEASSEPGYGAKGLGTTEQLHNLALA